MSYLMWVSGIVLRSSGRRVLRIVYSSSLFKPFNFNFLRQCLIIVKSWTQYRVEHDFEPLVFSQDRVLLYPDCPWTPGLWAQVIDPPGLVSWEISTSGQGPPCLAKQYFLRSGPQNVSAVVSETLSWFVGLKLSF